MLGDDPLSHHRPSPVSVGMYTRYACAEENRQLAEEERAVREANVARRAEAEEARLAAARARRDMAQEQLRAAIEMKAHVAEHNKELARVVKEEKKMYGGVVRAGAALGAGGAGLRWAPALLWPCGEARYAGWCALAGCGRRAGWHCGHTSARSPERSLLPGAQAAEERALETSTVQERHAFARHMAIGSTKGGGKVTRKTYVNAKEEEERVQTSAGLDERDRKLHERRQADLDTAVGKASRQREARARSASPRSLAQQRLARVQTQPAHVVAMHERIAAERRADEEKRRERLEASRRAT